MQKCNKITIILFLAAISQVNTAHNNSNIPTYNDEQVDINQSTVHKDIRNTLQQQQPQKALQSNQSQQQHDENKKQLKNDRNTNDSPIWIPRHIHNQHNQSHESLNSDNDPTKPLNVEDEEADTDLETDRLLGQQRLEDHGFYDDKV